MRAREARALGGAAPRLGLLAALAALLLATLVLANPVPGREEDVIKEVNALPRAIARLGTPGRRARFVELMSRGQFAKLRPGTLEFIRYHFKAFEPLFVESQSAGRGLDPALQKRFREWGSAGDREAMNQALRGWLTAPGPPPAIPGLVHVNYPPGAAQGVSPDQRVRAAEMLGDFRDLGALPELEALVRSTDFPEKQRWYVEQVIRRLHDPDSAVFLVLDDRGQTRCARILAEVESLQVCIPDRDGRWNVRVLDRQVAPSLWSEVARQNRAWRRSWYGTSSGEVRIRFRDGLMATLAVNSLGSIDYSNNSRQGGNPLILENPELSAIVHRVLAAARNSTSSAASRIHGRR